MLMRRTGPREIPKDLREITSAVRSQKPGSQVYAIANMVMSQMTSDEELTQLVRDEIAFVLATFSAHFVVIEVYNRCTYWRIPVAGCIYPYESVEAAEFSVDCLRVSIEERASGSECSVK